MVVYSTIPTPPKFTKPSGSTNTMVRRRPSGAAPASSAAAAPTKPDEPAATAAPRPPPTSLCEPITHLGVRWFQRLFLVALAYDSWCVASRGEMADFFGAPGRINFVYPAAPWVRPLPAHLMELLPHAIGGAALLSLAMPRLGLAALTGLQGFLFLCEAARYVNHFYLYLLLSLLLLLAALDTPASSGADCRAWHLLLLRLQLCAVYFFGGLVKCSRQFLLEGEPLRAYLRSAVAAGRPLQPLQAPPCGPRPSALPFTTPPLLCFHHHRTSATITALTARLHPPLAGPARLGGGGGGGGAAGGAVRLAGAPRPLAPHMAVGGDGGGRRLPRGQLSPLLHHPLVPLRLHRRLCSLPPRLARSAAAAAAAAAAKTRRAAAAAAAAGPRAPRVQCVRGGGVGGGAAAAAAAALCAQR